MWFEQKNILGCGAGGVEGMIWQPQCLALIPQGWTVSSCVCGVPVVGAVAGMGCPLGSASLPAGAIHAFCMWKIGSTTDRVNTASVSLLFEMQVDLSCSSHNKWLHGAPKPASHPLDFPTSVVQCSPSVLCWVYSVYSLYHGRNGTCRPGQGRGQCLPGALSLNP